ncbi:MAG: hypothetical protein JEY71_11835 [Sphaerochaeta sp.]|nr:hypothetical protein [Sphaerochaeta sp.]
MNGYRIKELKFEGLQRDIQRERLPHNGVVEIRKKGNQFCWKVFINKSDRLNDYILKGISKSSELAKEEAEKGWQDYIKECQDHLRKSMEAAL